MFFRTFDHQFVVEGSLGASKVTAWAPVLDFFSAFLMDLGNLLGVDFRQFAGFFSVRGYQF